MHRTDSVLIQNELLSKFFDGLTLLAKRDLLTSVYGRLILGRNVGFVL